MAAFEPHLFVQIFVRVGDDSAVRIEVSREGDLTEEAYECQTAVEIAAVLGEVANRYGLLFAVRDAVREAAAEAAR